MNRLDLIETLSKEKGLSRNEASLVKGDGVEIMRF